MLVKISLIGTKLTNLIGLGHNASSQQNISAQQIRDIDPMLI